MYMGRGVFFTIVLASSFSFLFAERLSVPRKKRHLFPLIGFLQGYKMGQDLALQLPPLLLSPVVVFPLNQEQSVHFHGNNDENYVENGFQVTPSEKLVQHCNSSDIGVHENRDDEDHTKESNEELLNEAGREEDAFRQSITNDTVTEANERENTMTTIIDVTQITATTVTETERDGSTTKSYEPYPTAAYNNDKIATLTITEAANDSDLMLPSIDNNWQNFTSKAITTESQVETRIGEVWSNDINYSKLDLTRDSTSYINNYYNGVKPSTDSYYRRPVYQPPMERWSTIYSGDNKWTAEFRPLAGLYYDGFLHKAPVKKQGFVPYGNKYYY